jgi:hypothetical protein
MRCFDAPEELNEILACEQNALDRAIQRGKDEWGNNFPAERYAKNCIHLMERRILQHPFTLRHRTGL